MPQKNVIFCICILILLPFVSEAQATQTDTIINNITTVNSADVLPTDTLATAQKEEPKPAVITFSNVIRFTDSDTLAIAETLTDTTFEDIEETGKSENVKSPSYIYMYLKSMPGFELYDNFDILSIHYKHQTVIRPDTLLLGEFSVPTKGRVTSTYGIRRRNGRYHWGVDIPNPTGTPVVAAFNGIVRLSVNGYNGGYGNLIILRHENNIETYYAHLSRRVVNPGQMVEVGDTIGYVGNTGRSYGSHLHFETRFLGMKFNPNTIIDFAKGELKTDRLCIEGKNVKSSISQTELLARKTGATSSSSQPTYIRVRRGDTLGHIASRNRTTVSSIKRLNGLRSDFIREGQRLRVR